MTVTTLPSGRTSSAQEAPVDVSGLAASRVAGAAPHEAQPLSGDSLQASLSSATRSSPFSPPVLAVPSTATYSDLGFIGVMNSFYDTGDTILRALSRTMQSSSTLLKNLAQENLEKLKAAAERTQDSDFWSLLKKIGQCILSAISIVLGVSLVATGAGSVVGAVMIASGIITIANFAMTETDTWDWVAKQLTQDEEKRKNIAFGLPTAVGLIGAVLGIGGGSAAAAIWSTLNMAQQALTIAQTALGLYEGATTVGKGVSDAKLLWSQADLVDVQHRTAVQRYFLDNTSKVTQAFIRYLEDAQNQAEQIISLIIQMSQKAVYQG